MAAGPERRAVEIHGALQLRQAEAKALWSLGQKMSGEPLPGLMEQLVCISRRTSADMKSEDEFALGGDRSPDPDAFGILFHLGHQFVQLQVADE